MAAISGRKNGNSVERFCGMLWKCKLPSCCRLTTIRLKLEVEPSSGRHLCWNDVRQTSLCLRSSSVRRRTRWHPRLFAFLAIIFNPVSETKLHGHTRKWMNASECTRPPPTLNLRHSKINSFQQMTDERALAIKTLSQVGTSVHVISARVQIKDTENDV